MNRLPHWSITDKFPAFFDTESATAIEQTAKLYGAMNTLIDSYNEWVDKINAEIEEFENSTDKNIEKFAMGLRQEFQDFIDVIELKIASQDKEIEDAVKYMKDNLNDTLSYEVNKVINEGVMIDLNYDEATESLTLIANKGGL